MYIGTHSFYVSWLTCLEYIHNNHTVMPIHTHSPHVHLQFGMHNVWRVDWQFTRGHARKKLTGKVHRVTAVIPAVAVVAAAAAAAAAPPPPPPPPPPPLPQTAVVTSRSNSNFRTVCCFLIFNACVSLTLNACTWCTLYSSSALLAHVGHTTASAPLPDGHTTSNSRWKDVEDRRSFDVM